MPKYLNTKEAAQLLRMGVTYVRDLVRAGKIPATKPTGHTILIDEADLMNFIQAGRSAPPAAASDPEVKS